MRSLAPLLALAACAASASPRAEPVPTPAAVPAAPATKVERFRASLAELQRRYRVPALSVAVYTDQGLQAAEALGVRRAGEAAPVELGDRFFIGSITKPVTATLAATLVDSGAISWTATPAEIWPAAAAAMHPQLRTATLRQLLSHEAGVPGFTSDEELATVPAAAGTPREQRAAFVRWLLGRPPAGPSGKNLYSNAGYGIAAAMLEQVTGKGWEDLVRLRIFQPLAMASCGFGWPRGAGDQPHGHRLVDGAYAEGSEALTSAIPAAIAPAGDIHCSMADLGRFGEAHLLGLAGRHPLLRPETFRTMHRMEAEEGYQLGWNIQEAGSQHRGGVTQGWHALLFVSPSSRIVVATGVNAREPGQTDELMTQATQLAFDLFRTSKGAD